MVSILFCLYIGSGTDTYAAGKSQRPKPKGLRVTFNVLWISMLIFESRARLRISNIEARVCIFNCSAALVPATEAAALSSNYLPSQPSRVQDPVRLGNSEIRGERGKERSVGSSVSLEICQAACPSQLKYTQNGSMCIAANIMKNATGCKNQSQKGC